MTDKVSPDVRSRMMSKVRSADTRPELSVRRLLHALGYRYRLHAKGLPGKPDISFSAKRKAIEIRGCFWHQHPDPNCPKATIPVTRRDWWEVKLRSNVARDARNAEALSQLGWDVLVIWECDLRSAERLRRQLIEFLGPPRT